MAITLEQVEKLKERANVSFETARAALEATGGDMLEAMLWLERQGKTSAPAGGTYSTRLGAGGAGTALATAQPSADRAGDQTGGGMGRRLWETLVDRICRSLRNQFEVVRHGRVLLSIPVLVLVVLVVAAFWAVVPLAVVGLVFGCRCHFSGADLGINRVMDSATQTTEESKRSAKNNLGRD